MTDVVLALLRRGDRWFVQRRALDNPVLPGLWEFPGGKCESGEGPEQALARELYEEIGLCPKALQAWPVQEGAVRLHPFLVEADGTPRTALAWAWCTVAELRCLSVPPRNQALIDWLAREPPDPELQGDPAHLIG